MTVANNLEMIEANLHAACTRANRRREDVTIIGVTKYVTIDRTKELLETGVSDIGENRVEEFQHKYETIESDATWHFIGTLQSRKVKDIIDQVSMIHSLDRESVAKQINKRSEKKVDCFIQVNVSGEETKHGLNIEEVIPFVQALGKYEKVRVVGLMTMAPHLDNESEVRAVFRGLRELKDDIKRQELAHAPCDYLSMGMSNDYEIAIEEGATHIRLGSTLLGADAGGGV